MAVLLRDIIANGLCVVNPDPANMPILGDLYDELLRQPEPEAARIASALELYVSGSLNVFNHRTNVELSNRLVCFDIKQLGKQLKKLGMLIVQDQVWNRVTVNRAEKKSTRYYMDEFHLLLKEEQTAAYSVEIWKRFRKWGGIPTAITQNVKDLSCSTRSFSRPRIKKKKKRAARSLLQRRTASNTPRTAGNALPVDRQKKKKKKSVLLLRSKGKNSLDLYGFPSVKTT